ncbi:MAG: hypothetical protein AUK47_21180 [Deltaproteobacteria bacterium CG2_30_63_29]|nr:MAG: hypothetical protein AUK47_21180 [Deltaproteobacteria bacterium CG2_30_63_29]
MNVSARIHLILFASLIVSACGGVVSQGELANTEEQQLDARDRGPFPWIGEEMGFSVRHAGSGAELLQVNVTVGQNATAEDGTQYIPISGSAVSIALARMFARVDDYADTFVDPKTWLPIYAMKDLNENERHRTYHVWFWSDELYSSVEKHQGNNVHKYNVPLPRASLDAISWVYHLRTIPLESGGTQSWYLYDGWKISRLSVVIQQKEDVWTPLGFYPAYRMDVYREKLDSFWPQGALSGVLADPQLIVTNENAFLGNVWIADDELHIPVRLAIETKLGDLDLLINNYHAPSAGAAPVSRAE